MAALDYDFSVLKKKEKSIAMKLGSLATAMRQYALAQEVKEYLKDHPNALIVNMGCGLDTTGHLADNGTCRFVNVDFPNVIEVREALIPKERRKKIVLRYGRAFSRCTACVRRSKSQRHGTRSESDQSVRNRYRNEFLSRRSGKGVAQLVRSFRFRAEKGYDGGVYEKRQTLRNAL